MVSEKKQIIKIYKIAGTIPEPNLSEIKEVIVENITINEMTNTTLNETITVNATDLSNVTANVTENLTANITTNLTETNTTELNVTNTTKIEYTWENIQIEFPKTRINNGEQNILYVKITEPDNTPIANDEQFEIKFMIDNRLGRKTEYKPTYEKQQWTTQILLPNEGKYTLIVNVKCADKQGYCKRFYAEGEKEASFEIEVV